MNKRTILGLFLVLSPVIFVFLIPFFKLGLQLTMIAQSIIALVITFVLLGVELLHE